MCIRDRNYLNQRLRYISNTIKLKRFTAPPIIIGGCARSGTTLLQAIISAHPRIFVFPIETHRLCPTAYLENPDYTLKPRYEDLMEQLKTYPVRFSARRWCEKTPKNIRFIDHYLKDIEDVKIIHIIRDGRDVITSKHPDDPEEYWVPIQRWIDDVQAGLLFKDHPQVFTIKYEDLIFDFEKQLEKLGLFLKEDFSKIGKDWTEKASLQRSTAWFSDRVTQLNAKSIYKWKKEEYKPILDSFMANEKALSLLNDLGYNEVI